MLHGFKRLIERGYGSASVLLVLCAVFWAGNAIASRVAVGQITPLTLVLLRWVLVIAVLWPLYGSLVRAHWPHIKGRLPGIVLMAALGFTGFNVLFYMAGHYTSALNIGILQGSMPAMVMLGAYFAHGTRVSLLQMAGVLITMLGVVVVATHGEPLSLAEMQLNIGDLLILASCVLYAFYTVALRNRPQMPGPAFFTLLALIAALTSVPLVVFEALNTGLKVPTPAGFLVTVFIAIFPSCLAQLFMMRGVDLIGPGHAGVYVNLVPVFSAVENVELALLANGGAAVTSGSRPWPCSTGSVSATAVGTAPQNYPVASSNASPSPGPSSANPP